jgi:diaminopimelate epimerase
MKFTKMHGLGNCYIFVDCFKEKVQDPVQLATVISDRNRGVGSDGLILICPSEKADARMEMYNMDGSRAQMCGNGIRCFAKYVYDYGLSDNNPLQVETDTGVLGLDMTVENGRVSAVRVDMGEPKLEPEDLPTTLAKAEMFNRSIEVMEYKACMTCVSMGNPHAVIYGVPLERLDPATLRAEGSSIENDPAFPERINAHFVEVNAPDEVTMIPWERGSGPTQACGTGAAAVCVAGVLTNNSARKVTVHLPGGDLLLEWQEATNHVFLTGPAVEIFNGDWPEDR